MKKTKIVVPALAVLLLSTAASVSGTVAWFSMNTQIKVTGMTVTTKVSSNLQIAEENNDAFFSSDNLQQARSGILEPASTVDGDSYFYTVNAKNNGEATSADPAARYTAYSEATNALGTNDKTNSGKDFYDATFNQAYGFQYSTDSDPDVDGDDGLGNGNVSFAYIDYSFYLKAYTTGSEKISLTRCNMTYNNGSLTTEHAWRVAFFAHEVDQGDEEDNDATTDPENSALVSILNFEQSKNQNQVETVKVEVGDTIPADTYHKKAELTDEAVADGVATAETAGTYYKAADGELEPKAVSGVAASAVTTIDGRDTANHKGAKAEVTPTGASNHYYKVVIRLWLEGEDVTCTSDTFATLTNQWKLDLGFKLGNYDGVQYLSNNAAAE